MTIRGLIIISMIFLSACSSQEQADFNSAQKQIELKHYRIALASFDQVIKRNKTQRLVLESLRESARISFYEIQDYSEAVYYYRLIVLKSPDAKERISAQKQIAQIFFDNLQDYSQAIVEFSKLLQMKPNIEESNGYRINIARAWFYTNNFFQARSEVESLLKLPLDDDAKFDVRFLKSNILLADKKYQEASTELINLLELNPERATKENVILTLAVCYEENFDYKTAIQMLEKYKGFHNQPEYIDLRIKRLKERMRNAPGARGMRK